MKHLTFILSIILATVTISSAGGKKGWSWGWGWMPKPPKQWEKPKNDDKEKPEGDDEEEKGVPLADVTELLGTVVKGFSPEICGYSTLRRFVKNQQPKFCKFDKKKEMVYAPEK